MFINVLVNSFSYSFDSAKSMLDMSIESSLSIAAMKFLLF